MNEENGIKSFEDLFKEEKPNNLSPIDRTRFGLAIAVYFIFQFVVGLLIVLSLSSVKSLRQTFTEEEVVLKVILGNQEAYTVMLESEYDKYKDVYGRVLNHYAFTYDNNDYVFIYHPTMRQYVLDLLFIPVEDEMVFDIDTFISIQKGEVKYWDSDTEKLEFKFIYGQNQPVLPEAALNPNYSRKETEGYAPLFNILVNFLLYILMFPLILYILRFDILVDFKTFVALKINAVSSVALGYLGVIGGNVFSQFISLVLSYILDVPQTISVNQATIEMSLHSSYAWLMIIPVIFLGPIVEELIFRKSFFALFKNDYVALAVSSIVFGIIHLTSETSIANALVNGPSYFIMGVVFGGIYLLTKKNIWIVSLVHILVNGISVLGILFL
ncbi:MAG: type II CAAX endopeptidase family protein [Acholeplasmataceae bacterium]